MTRSSARLFSSLILGAWLGATLFGCATMGMRAAVDMTVRVAPDTPGSALVYVDGQYIGGLAAVAARGVRLPEGKHRLTIEKVGYFPFDTIVVSRIDPIFLEVELLELPD